MNHWHYIAIAYAAFSALMTWDYFAPRWSLRLVFRSIRMNQRGNNKL